MKRIFLDTNIVLDLLMRDEYKAQIRELIRRCSDDIIYISYLTVANAAYIMRKCSREDLNANLNLILELFEIIPNEKRQIERAIKIDGKDFEDILQYESAKSMKCEVILTRNVKDYQFSEIPIMDVAQFLLSLS